MEHIHSSGKFMSQHIRQRSCQFSQTVRRHVHSKRLLAILSHNFSLLSTVSDFFDEISAAQSTLKFFNNTILPSESSRFGRPHLVCKDSVEVKEEGCENLIGILLFRNRAPVEMLALCALSLVLVTPNFGDSVPKDVLENATAPSQPWISSPLTSWKRSRACCSRRSRRPLGPRLQQLWSKELGE